VYIDDLNIIGHIQDINKARNHLTMEFEMKNLGHTKFYLGLQLEHLSTGIFMHQAAYIQNILEKFNMDKSYPSKIPMVVRSLDIKRINLDHEMMEKNCWDLRFLILVPLER
jgi:hypothetical protein